MGGASTPLPFRSRSPPGGRGPQSLRGSGMMPSAIISRTSRTSSRRRASTSSEGGTFDLLLGVPMTTSVSSWSLSSHVMLMSPSSFEMYGVIRFHLSSGCCPVTDDKHPEVHQCDRPLFTITQKSRRLTISRDAWSTALRTFCISTGETISNEAMASLVQSENGRRAGPVLTTADHTVS